jgi:hypothetical protein
MARASSRRRRLSSARGGVPGCVWS